MWTGRDFPGGFPGAAADAFTVAGRTPEQAKTFDWVHERAARRSTNTALAGGAEQVLRATPNAMVYGRYGTSGCTGLRSRGGDLKPMLVVSERGAFTPLQVDLHATALRGCHPGKPVPGEALATLADEKLTITPSTNFVVLPCL